MRVFFFLFHSFFFPINGSLSDLRQFLSSGNPLKLIKNAVCFMLKALFVLESFKFFPWPFCYIEKRLDKKVMVVNFKIYDVTTGQQTITLHVLPNISRSKGNQAIKFGQLIQYSVKNVFSEIMQKLRSGEWFQTSFFEKALYKVKASCQHLSFNIFW